MGDAQQPVTIAEATPAPPAEATTPAGPTVSELQAQIADWQERYKKEIGDRDRGMAKQAQKLKDMEDELVALRNGTDSLARKVHGVEDAEESEYDRWRKAHSRPEPVPVGRDSFTPTADHIEATGRMKQMAKLHKVDYFNPPAEMADEVKKVIAAYRDDPEKAADIWEQALTKREQESKTRAAAEAKTKRDELEKKAKAGQRDTSPSTGGGHTDYNSIRDAWLKNPNDPGARQAYMEARRARGL